ncbi:MULTISPECIES: transposase [unclassified Moorena]|uniref:IS66 family transposase n=1 Tax=unclassified Moorena TaxID=2683338 RepID=UPI0025EB4582|nr:MULTISPECIES: transposase [unclassified Moorena]
MRKSKPFYGSTTNSLIAYQDHPSAEQKQYLSARFDEIFGRCYLHHPTLSNALNQFRQNKEQLLRVLDKPNIPLHNNAAESDIREFVTRRKISGGTRSEAGRKARDTMIGLKKTIAQIRDLFLGVFTVPLARG